MRKHMKTIFLFLVICLLFLCFDVYAENDRKTENNLFSTDGIIWITNDAYLVNNKEIKKGSGIVNLPESLTVIDESAFEGTAITTISLPENLKTIENNAFANIPSLKTINIPNSTTYIGKDAFIGSRHVTITAVPTSYARAYAQENKIPFNPITSFYAFTPAPQATSWSNGRAEQQQLFVEGETTDNQKENQTGRMTGDLNAERYEYIIAFHIQGRSPPMG